MKARLLGGLKGRWTITMTLTGGHQTEISSTDWDLREAILDELKAVSTFQRQVVKSWQELPQSTETGGRLVKKSLL
jgi:hypothetical protein